MNITKKKILLILVSAIFLFSGNRKILFADSINALKRKDVKSQAEFINSLSKKEKFGFLQKFLPGSCFAVSPWVDTKFFNDGKALNFDSGLGLYFYTHWRVTNNFFKIWKQKDSDPFPENKKEYVLIDLTTAEGRNDSLWLTFANSKNIHYSFEYAHKCLRFKDGDFWYERYKKSFKQNWNVFLGQIYWGGPNESSGAKLINNDNLRLNTGRDGYLGVFHFGQSERKSELFIVISNKKIYGQWKRSKLIDNETKRIWDYANLDHVTIHNGVLKAKGWSGKFVKYYEGSTWLTGLIIQTSPIGIHNEFGVKKEDYGMMVETFFYEYIHGNYKQTYFKKLEREDLKDLSKKDLNIMRNEIFARYGYKFKPGGSMDRYFRSQNWYEPQYKDVSSFLTDLEKQNIKFIRRHE